MITPKEAAKTPKKTSKKTAKVLAVDKAANGNADVAVTHTVAHHVDHAEAVQAIENENKEVAIETKPPQTTLEIARAAWAEVKDAADPEFDECVSLHRDKFIAHAESILAGGQSLDGDTLLARFEQAIQRLNKEKN